MLINLCGIQISLDCIMIFQSKLDNRTFSLKAASWYHYFLMSTKRLMSASKSCVFQGFQISFVIDDRIVQADSGHTVEATLLCFSSVSLTRSRIALGWIFRSCCCKYLDKRFQKSLMMDFLVWVVLVSPHLERGHSSASMTLLSLMYL